MSDGISSISADLDPDFGGSMPKPNVAELTHGPCLHFYSAHHSELQMCVEFLLGLDPPEPFHEGLIKNGQRIDIEFPLDRIGFRTAPRSRRFHMVYEASFRVIAQYEPLPPGWIFNGSGFFIQERSYDRFVQKYNQVAGYYGLEELKTETGQTPPQKPRFRFVIFGWRVESPF